MAVSVLVHTTFLNAYVKNDINAWRSIRFGDLSEATDGKATIALK